MTRRRILLTLFSAMAVSAVIVIISLAGSLRSQRAEAYRRSIESSVIETEPEVGYILKEYQGELAVFRGDSSTPCRLLRMPVSLMSEQDRSELKEGIYVSTKKELDRLIEDFVS